MNSSSEKWLKTFVLSALLSSGAQKISAADLTPRQIYQADAPAVVLIMCIGEDGNGELGTGSVIDESGTILTNAHVVIRGSTKKPFETIRVYFKPAKITGDNKQDLGDFHLATVASHDRALDLAVLKLEDKPANLKVLPIGDADVVESGEPVVAIGHPEQGGLWTLTTGVVSTIIANLGGVAGKDVFQTDASINRGNSGGPLINRAGALIGVNTSMARKAPDGLTITSVNFSVKSSVVKNWLARANVKADYQEPAPAPAAPAQAEEKVVEALPPQPEKPAISVIVTPKKPFKIEDLIQKEMAEMDDLEREMHQEVEKRREAINYVEPPKKKR